MHNLHCVDDVAGRGFDSLFLPIDSADPSALCMALAEYLTICPDISCCRPIRHLCNHTIFSVALHESSCNIVIKEMHVPHAFNPPLVMLHPLVEYMMCHLPSTSNLMMLCQQELYNSLYHDLHCCLLCKMSNKHF